MKIKKIFDNQRGFTLIEAMIAIAVLVIGILIVISMQFKGIFGNAKANHITGATDSASEKVESLLALDYDDNALIDDVVGTLDSTSKADGNDSSFDGSYNIYWNIADDSIVQDTKTIHVIVERREGGEIKTTTFKYLKAKDL